MRDLRRNPGGATRWQIFTISFALVLLRLLGFVLLAYLLVSLVLVVVWIGIPMMVVGLLLLRGFANLHRTLAGKILGTVIARPGRVRSSGVFPRFAAGLADPMAWRELGWLVQAQTISIWFEFAAFFAYPILPLGLWGSPIILRAVAGLDSTLLSPAVNPEMTERIGVLEHTRAQTVDHQAAELRRIERDLHDGAQARLVGLGMNLGLAEQMIKDNPLMAAELIAEARASSSAALTELRDLVRGIHPPVLADRGLVGGIDALALAHPVSVDVDAVLDGRPPAPVESAIYFAIAEALANSAKHSGAIDAWVWLRYTSGAITVLVGDNGGGGAAIGGLTDAGGLRGIQKRLSAFDGTLSMTSPLGGPTIVTIDVPATLNAAQPTRRSTVAS